MPNIRQCRFLRRNKQNLCASQRRIARRLNYPLGRFNQANVDGAVNPDIVAERAGKINAFEIAGLRAEML